MEKFNGVPEDSSEKINEGRRGFFKKAVSAAISLAGVGVASEALGAGKEGKSKVSFRGHDFSDFEKKAIETKLNQLKPGAEAEVSVRKSSLNGTEFTVVDVRVMHQGKIYSGGKPGHSPFEQVIESLEELLK